MNQCYICNSPKTAKLFSSFNVHGRKIINEDEKFDIFKCQKCGVVFLNSDKKINYSQYYGENYYCNSGESFSKFMQLLIKISEDFSFTRKEQLILKYFKNYKSKIAILDIGCGEGKFLLNLDKNKFIKKGIEINKDACRSCKKRSLSVLNKDFLKIEFNSEKYEVITLWHVLEHLDNPRAVLEKINRILKPNGILVISTPNIGSVGFKIGKSRWFHIDSPRHRFLYNKKSLKFLLNKEEFEIMEVKSEFYDYFLDLFWSLKNSIPKILLLLFYPLLKIYSKETITLIGKKQSSDRKKAV